MSLLLDDQTLENGALKLEAVTAPGDIGHSFYLASPTACPPKALVVSVHGISRNAEEHALAVGREAARHGFATLAPIFDELRYPAYQRLGRMNGTARSDFALEAFVDLASDRLKLDGRRFFLAGFSGGAQFAHRYALHNPNRVRALGLAAAGWYTALAQKRAFPKGLRDPGRRSGQPVNLAGFLAIPMLVAVGDKDVMRDPALRQSPKLDAEQGENRVERGRRWLQSVQETGEALGVQADRRFLMLPRTGHSFTDAIAPDRGNLARIWSDYFAAADRGEL